MRFAQRFSLAFAAGALGGLANVAFLAVVAAIGIPALLGVKAGAPEIPGFLYKQVAWGGLWGFLLLVPIFAGSWWKRGLVLGTLAALSTGLIFTPMAGAGYFAAKAGDLTFIVIFAANWVWGLVASYWYDRVE